MNSLHCRPPGAAPTRVFLIAGQPRAGARLLRRFDGAGFAARSSACCRHAESAVRLWNPDVVVVDGDEPLEEWTSLAARLASDAPARTRVGAAGVPAFVIAGRDARPVTCRSVLEHGAADFVRTPYHFSELAARVARAAAVGAERATLRADAATDDVTGLWNRRHLGEWASELRATLARAGRPLACLVAAVDELAAIHARFGKVGGDAVLRGVATQLGGAVRAGDLAFRIGGDAFLILAADVDLPGGRRLAERLRRAVGSAPIGVPGTAGSSPRLTVSLRVGVSEWAPRASYRATLRAAEQDLRGGDGQPATLHDRVASRRAPA